MFVSLTQNRSIFYRFKIKEWEFKIENFIDTEDGIESVLHIYKNGIKIQPSYFGTIKEICTHLISLT